MERIRNNNMETYLDAMMMLHELGIKNLACIGHHDTIRIVVSDYAITAPILKELAGVYDFDLYPTEWDGDPSISIIIRDNVSE